MSSHASGHPTVPEPESAPPSNEAVPPSAESTPVVDGAAVTLRLRSTNPALGEMPDHLHGFTLERVLGWGATGVVYLARQQSPERSVALKMLRSGSFSDFQAQCQFSDEANTIAGLNHPHVVQIFQVIMDQGQPILVLEHCEGGSLEQGLRDHLPTPTEAATLVRILAETMQAVHHADVIHRDLKPGNILLTRNGTPKITDFGLARSATPSESLLGRVAGTPSYTSRG